MTGISESIIRAELAALHEQILIVHGETNLGTAWNHIFDLVGMLPDEIRPKGVPSFSLYRDPTKPTQRKADDML